MNQTFLYIWLGVMTFTLVASTLARWSSGRKAPLSQDFVVAGFALSTAIALVKVLIKVISQESLQAELDWDGTIALCISSFLGIYLSLKEVVKLF